MKQKNLRLATMMTVACLTALLASGCGPPEPAREAATTEETPPVVALEPPPSLVGAGFAPSDNRRIELTYQDFNDACAEDQTGDTCVLTDPLTATIWKDKNNNSGKPKKVRWWIPRDQKGVYYFEIVHKGDPAENWLNTVEAIDCNSNHTTSIKPDPDDLPSGDVDWPYRVTVFQCTEAGDQGECLCQTDPIIRIHE